MTDDATFRVESLGDADTPLPQDVADLASGTAELEEEAPLTEEQQRELLAGLLELPFGLAGSWMARGLPDPYAAQVVEVWSLEPDEAHQLADSAWLAMPRTWRESRALARSPLIVLALQTAAVLRGRLVATVAIRRIAQEAPDGSGSNGSGERAAPGARRTPGAAPRADAEQPATERSTGGGDGFEGSGFGLGGDG
jgi:hypothetical protein